MGIMSVDWKERLGINPLSSPEDVEVARVTDEYGAIQVYDRGDERYLTIRRIRRAGSGHGEHGG